MKDRKQNKPPYNTRQDTFCRDDIKGKNKQKTNKQQQPKIQNSKGERSQKVHSV